MQQRGITVVQVDNRHDDGGGDDHDLLNDDFFTYLLEHVRSGHFDAVFAAPPCSTYSVARFFETDSGGPPP
eukprot:5746502-Prymnesium_polylepis.1